ncbi:MAG: arsenate reductase (thioredoxin) [Sporolactobacillus sp.]|jgi:arsenate reductase|nr:arsenate reductase (thioredoxin) [Sporolactobacillus sp.]
MTKKMIYFLCTGNACRSQMAEGFGKKYLGDAFDVRSAGIEAHGLNPDAVEAMQEVNIDISRQQSKVIDRNLLNQAYLIVTLCGDAEERCPITPPQVRREHWGFEDPAKAQGTAAERQAVFRHVRDGIAKRIKQLAEEEKARNDLSGETQ